MRGKAPSVRLLQRAHSDVNRTVGPRQYKCSDCGRKAVKGTPKVQKYIAQCLVHLRKRTTCTSSTLRRELLHDKGVELTESAIRKILRSNRAQKREYSAHTHFRYLRTVSFHFARSANSPLPSGATQ